MHGYGKIELTGHTGSWQIHVASDIHKTQCSTHEYFRRNRCLNPGKYSHYLERWLAEYNSHQLHIIDGTQLRTEPAAVMNTLQKFLKISPHIDYNKHLK